MNTMFKRVVSLVLTLCLVAGLIWLPSEHNHAHAEEAVEAASEPQAKLVGDTILYTNDFSTARKWEGLNSNHKFVPSDYAMKVQKTGVGAAYFTYDTGDEKDVATNAFYGGAGVANLSTSVDLKIDLGENGQFAIIQYASGGYNTDRMISIWLHADGIYIHAGEQIKVGDYPTNFKLNEWHTYQLRWLNDGGYYVELSIDGAKVALDDGDNGKANSVGTLDANGGGGSDCKFQLVALNTVEFEADKLTVKNAGGTKVLCEFANEADLAVWENSAPELATVEFVERVNGYLLLNSKSSACYANLDTFGPIPPVYKQLYLSFDASLHDGNINFRYDYLNHDSQYVGAITGMLHRYANITIVPKSENNVAGLYYGTIESGKAPTVIIPESIDLTQMHNYTFVFGTAYSNAVGGFPIACYIDGVYIGTGSAMNYSYYTYTDAGAVEGGIKGYADPTDTGFKRKGNDGYRDNVQFANAGNANTVLGLKGYAIVDNVSLTYDLWKDNDQVTATYDQTAKTITASWNKADFYAVQWKNFNDNNTYATYDEFINALDIKTSTKYDVYVNGELFAANVDGTEISKATELDCGKATELVIKVVAAGYDAASEGLATTIKLEHTAGAAVKENETAASCTGDGSYDMVVYCSVCKAELSRETTNVASEGHKEQTVEGYAATHATTGLTDGVQCSVCKAWIVEQTEIPVIAHEYTAKVTEPTCTEKGYTTYTCECGVSYVDNYVDAKGHNKVAIQDAVAPNCVKPGATAGVKCETCGTVIENVAEIPALGHKEQTVEGYAATHTTTGLTDGVQCSVCEAWIVEQTEIPMIKHDYKAEVTEPTCTEKGYTTYTCECGVSYVDNYVDAKGHAWGDWETIQDATCVEDGSKKCECAECHTIKTEVIKANGAHTEATRIENETFSSCTEAGKYDKVTYCSVCNEVLNRETITKDLAAHTEETIPAVDATCTTAGATAGKKCSVCDKVLEAPVATNKLPHVAASSKETERVAATLNAPGYYVITSYCACGEITGTETFEIPQLTGAVAKIGNTFYATLQEALAAATNNDTIVLLAPVTIEAGEELVINKHVTYTSDVMGESMFVNKGKLTIAANGYVEYVYTGAADTTNAKGNYGIENRGELIVNGMIAVSADMAVYAPMEKIPHAFYAINNNGTASATINDGAFIVNYNGYAIRQVASATAHINTLTVNGGYVMGVRAVWMQAAGSNTAEAPTISLTVKGGTLESYGEGDYTLAVYSYSYGNSMANMSVTVSGGELIGDVALTGGKNKTVAETVTVTGGKITDLYSYAADAVACQTVKVMGGTFDQDVSVYVVEGKHMVKKNGVYTICTAAAKAPVKENEVIGNCTTATTYEMVTYCECGKELSREFVTGSVTGHTAGEAVKENIVDATLNAAGSYDEVVYCSVCEAELSRVKKDIAQLTGAAASVEGFFYATLQEAIDAANGKTVVIEKDIELTETLTIAAGKVVTIDLNGHKITRTVTETVSENTYLLLNNGDLTITGDGLIELTYQGEKVARSVSTICNCGVLNILGGKINNNAGKNNIAYAIDNNSTLRDAVINMNGGSVTGGASYYSIRMFLNSTVHENTLNMTGGNTNYIWAQNPNTYANKGSINLTGDAYAWYVYVSAVEGNCNVENVKMYVEAATSYYAPACGTLIKGYELQNIEGVYQIVPVTYVAQIGEVGYTSLQAAINAATAGQTITVLMDIELTETLTIAAGKVVTIDLNGKTVSYNVYMGAEEQDEAILNNGTLIIDDSSATGAGKITSYYDHPANQNNALVYPYPTYGSNTITNRGHLTIKNGTIECTTVGDSAFAIDTGNRYGDATLVIEGGYIVHTSPNKSGAIRVVSTHATNLNKLVMTGGVVSGRRGITIQMAGGNKAVSCPAIVEISGGVINSIDTNAAKYRAIYSWSDGIGYDKIEITISGTAVLNGNVHVGDDYTTGMIGAEKVRIIGGTINGEVKSLNPVNKDIEISGGIFATDVSEFLAEGLHLAEVAEGYTVCAKAAQAPVKANEKAATCTTDGSYDMVTYCECGKELKRETFTIKAEGHKAGEAVKENVVEATLNNAGSYDLVVYCSVCNEKLSSETVVVEQLTGAAASVEGFFYATLQEAIDAANGKTVVIEKDIDLGAGNVIVKAGYDVTINLNGKTISGISNGGGEAFMIRVENTAKLTIEDKGENGKITLARGTNGTAFVIDVKGDLVLNSGILEQTGSWSIGFVVDIRPNAWGTAYTKPTSFTMNGGKIIAGDGAVRVDSNSGTNERLGVTFTMNGGEIDAVYDGIFIQHRYANDLYVNIVDGIIASDFAPIRIYGSSVISEVYVNISGGTFQYTGEAGTTGWVVENFLKTNNETVAAAAKFNITGGQFEGDVTKLLAEGKHAAQKNGIYTICTAAAKAPVKENEVTGNCTTDTTYEMATYCECGKELSRETVEIEATGHAYEAVVTAPTCTAGGYTTYTCACGDAYVADEVAATGHTYEAVVTAPTCTAGGYTTYTCACGDAYVADEVAALEHKYNDGETNCYICGAGERYVKPTVTVENGVITVLDPSNAVQKLYAFYLGQEGISSNVWADLVAAGKLYPAVNGKNGVMQLDLANLPELTVGGKYVLVMTYTTQEGKSAKINVAATVTGVTYTDPAIYVDEQNKVVAELPVDCTFDKVIVSYVGAGAENRTWNAMVAAGKLFPLVNGDAGYMVYNMTNLPELTVGGQYILYLKYVDADGKSVTLRKEVTVEGELYEEPAEPSVGINESNKVVFGGIDAAAFDKVLVFYVGESEAKTTVWAELVTIGKQYQSVNGTSGFKTYKSADKLPTLTEAGYYVIYLKYTNAEGKIVTVENRVVVG